MARDEQIKDRLFPGVKTFRPARGGFAAMPFVMRRVQWLFDPRAWQVYTYVVMRIGPKGIGWLTMPEMSFDLGFKSIPKLRLYIDQLVKDGWLQHKRSRAREYFVAPDPVRVLRALVAQGRLDDERIDHIDELLESLGWKPLRPARRDDGGAENRAHDEALDKLLGQGPATAGQRSIEEDDDEDDDEEEEDDDDEDEDDDEPVTPKLVEVGDVFANFFEKPKPIGPRRGLEGVKASVEYAKREARRRRARASEDPNNTDE